MFNLSSMFCKMYQPYTPFFVSFFSPYYCMENYSELSVSWLIKTTTHVTY
jgi:hypothetical protein